MSSFSSSLLLAEYPVPDTTQRASTRVASLGWRILVPAVILFLLQVIPFLGRRWVTDESWYAGPAYSIAHGNGVRDPAIGPNDLENRFDARPPGTALVISAFFKTIGDGPIPARLGSVLAGLISVLLVYRLTRDILDQEAAAIAALVMATDNLIVLTSRSARPEALTVMMVLLGLLAMMQYQRSGLLRWPFVSGLLMAMGAMFHVTLLGYVVSFGIMAIMIDRRTLKFAARGASAYASGFLLGLIPFALWITRSPLGRAGFREEYMGRAVNDSLALKFLQEGKRYSDLLGLNMLHGHGFEHIPVRLPIPLIFLAATYLLWRHRRTFFYIELLLLIPSVLWFIDTANKSSRYLALLAPIFATVIGAAVSAVRGHRLLRPVMFTCAALVIIAQLSANLMLLNNARKADYEKVGQQLRSFIPPGETAYGTITFWLAFRDRPYISYERTEPWMAAHQFHARYFILGDRTMTNGDAWEGAFYKVLNKQLAEITSQSDLVGQFHDPYYGDLAVYRLHEGAR